MPFNITLDDGVEVEVLLSSYDLNSISHHGFKGCLIPTRYPCLIVDTESRFRSVQFELVNFSSFFQEEKLFEAKMFETDKYFEISVARSISNDERTVLKGEGGIAVTHRGTIGCTDDAGLSGAEIWQILDGLAYFLSFSQGSRCAVIRVQGSGEKGGSEPMVWGSKQVDPYIEQAGVLFTANEGREPLSDAWPGFWRLFRDGKQRNAIRNAIDWYLIGNNADFATGLILGQTGLELLCKTTRHEKTAKAIRCTICALKIDSKVPQQCRNLANAAEKYGWNDGPHSITKIRNELVHTIKDYPSLMPEAQLEACQLALWYMELILLNKFKYEGRYKKRSQLGSEEPYGLVPWARTSDPQRPHSQE